MAEPVVPRDTFSKPLWAGILAVYVLLLGVSGYLAFLIDVPRQQGGGGQYNPAHASIEFLEKAAANKENHAYVLETLRADSATYQKKRELASQSFNVVLGALLGFLSASATLAFGQRVTRQDRVADGEVSPNRPLRPASGEGGSAQSKPS